MYLRVHLNFRKDTFSSIESISFRLLDTTLDRWKMNKISRKEIRGYMERVRNEVEGSEGGEEFDS